MQVAGFVVREHSLRPSHSLSDMTLDEYLQAEGITGISGVDTRAITRRLRTQGVMMGAIGVDESPDTTLARLEDIPAYGELDFVRQVTTESAYDWNSPLWQQPAPGDDAPHPRQRLRLEVQHPAYAALSRLRGGRHARDGDGAGYFGQESRTGDASRRGRATLNCWIRCGDDEGTAGQTAGVRDMP